MGDLLGRRAPLWSPSRAHRRLTVGILLFAVLVGVPLGLLMGHVYNQLRLESYLQLRSEADDLVSRIDARLHELISEEESRRFEEFSFLTVAGDSKANFIQLSPLSRMPPETRLPGVVGFFQLAPDGGYSTPLLPRNADSLKAVAAYGIDGRSFKERRELELQLLDVLKSNDIANATGPEAAQVAEEKLTLSKSQVQKSLSGPKDDPSALPDQLELDTADLADFKPGARTKKKAPVARPRQWESRKVQVAIPESSPDPGPGVPGIDGQAADKPRTLIRTFEGEIDPFQFGLLTSGHAVLFRKVWRDRQRHIQGVIMRQAAFLEALVSVPYESSPLSADVTLEVLHGQSVIARYNPVDQDTAPRQLVARQQLSAPFGNLELRFSVGSLASGPNVRYVFTVSLLLLVVLAAGLLAIYLAGRRQIALGQQQRDFVSAVSHELKTPLTSIRMYSEMLREGWATEEKRQGYYDFIFNESERLSRLIANVLQLARLSRGQPLNCRPVQAAEAYAACREVISGMTATAGFTHIESRPDPAPDALCGIDPDALTQVMVNLVDNGIKFSLTTAARTIETGYTLSPTGREVRFFVRDHGPGIQKDQIRKIFRLFYRPGNELTRTTKGTGIGLALVRELMTQMHGQIDVVSRPGLTEFTLTFPVLPGEAAPRPNS